jgi:hypothetical protein
MSANTRLGLAPLNCPRPGCGRPMQVLMNGGGLYLRCSNEPPKCGIIVPAETATAWANEQRMTDTIEPDLGEDGKAWYEVHGAEPLPGESLVAGPFEIK